MFLAMARAKLPQVAVQQIKGMIDSGELQPGDRLPTERELTQQLKVSRNSVREALRTLEALGLVEVKPGRGTFVHPGARSGSPEGAQVSLPSFQDDIGDIIEARTIIETSSCSLAAQRATQEDIDEMQAGVSEMREAFASGDVIRMALADARFHNAIISATKNAVLIRIGAEFSRQSLGSRRVSLSNHERATRSIGQHHLMAEAIAAGDGDWASSIMLDHLRGVAAHARMLESQRQNRPVDGSVQRLEDT